MQAMYAAPWDACQEQFLTKLSPASPFQGHESSSSSFQHSPAKAVSLAAGKHRLIYTLHSRENGWVYLLGKGRLSVWVPGLVERTRQTTLEAKVISSVWPRGHQLNCMSSPFRVIPRRPALTASRTLVSAPNRFCLTPQIARASLHFFPMRSAAHTSPSSRTCLICNACWWNISILALWASQLLWVFSVWQKQAGDYVP